MPFAALFTWIRGMCGYSHFSDNLTSDMDEHDDDGNTPGWQLKKKIQRPEDWKPEPAIPPVHLHNWNRKPPPKSSSTQPSPPPALDGTLDDYDGPTLVMETDGEVGDRFSHIREYDGGAAI